MSGLTVAGDRRHAEGDERRQLAARRVHRRGRLRRAGREARRASSRARSAARWRRSGRSSARTSASSARRSRCARTACATRVRIGDAVDFEIEDVVPFGVEYGEPARLTGHLPPGRLGADGRAGDALEDRRVRDQLRGQVGLLDVAVLLGGVSARDRRAALRTPATAAASSRAAFAAARARLGLIAAAVRARRRRVVVDRRPDGRDGRRARGPTSARSAGSSASGS